MIYAVFNMTDRVEGANWDSFKSFENRQELASYIESMREDIEVGFSVTQISKEEFDNKEVLHIEDKIDILQKSNHKEAVMDYILHCCPKNIIDEAFKLFITDFND
jgi:hypothetical protein